MDDFIEIDGVRFPIIVLTCCKEWPILMGLPWGRCGDCGDRPRKR